MAIDRLRFLSATWSVHCTLLAALLMGREIIAGIEGAQAHELEQAGRPELQDCGTVLVAEPINQRRLEGEVELRRLWSLSATLALGGSAAPSHRLAALIT